MLKNVIIKSIEKIAPLSLAESWDNVGLLIESPIQRTSRIFLTIDLTPQVLDEAISQETSLIIAYHPPLFTSIKRLTMGDVKQSLAIRMIQNGISCYSPHSALDSCVGGINDWLASGLGKGTTLPIHPSVDDPLVGVGRIHVLDEAVSLSEIINRIKAHLRLQHVRVASTGTGLVKTIAICAGSGNSVVKDCKADLYYTGEMSHHDILAAVAKNTNVVLCEHTNTERGYLEQVLKPRLTELLKNDGIDADIICSKVDKDPIEIV